MRRVVEMIAWICAIIALALVMARWPQCGFLLTYATMSACVYFFIRRDDARPALRKFSLRTILFVMGLIGCFLAYSKQRQTWERVHSFPGHVSTVTMSPDGKLVAATVGTSIELRETETGKPLKTLQMPVDEATPKKNTLWLCDLAFSEDNTNLLTAGWRDQVHLYDWMRGEPIRSWPDDAYMSRISRSGRFFATTNIRSGEYRVYDVDQLEPVQEFKSDGTAGRRYSELSATGKYLVLPSKQSGLMLWDVETGNRCFEMQSRSIRAHIILTSISPDEKRIAIPIDEGITIWDIEKAEQVGAWKPAGFDDLRSMEWSPDGTRLLATYVESIGPSAPVQKAVHHCFLLDSQGQEISEVVGNSATFTASGDRVATVYGTCNILDGRTGEFLTTVPTSNPNESMGGYRELYFSPDGNWLLTSGRNGSAGVFRRLRSEWWYSVLNIPAYWGMIIFLVLIVRETLQQVRSASAESSL